MPSYGYEALTPKFLCICWRGQAGRKLKQWEEKNSAVICVLLFSGLQLMAFLGRNVCQGNRASVVCLGAKQTHVSCIIQTLGHVTEDPFQFHESNKLCGT